jgi:alpha-D-xyloside xylohydrolase
MDFTQFDRLITLAPSTAAPHEATAISLEGVRINFALATCGKGIFRLRMNPVAKPDYGLVSPTIDTAAAVVQGDSSVSISAGSATLTLASDVTHAISLTLQYKGNTLLTSITDEQFRGMAKPLEATRLPAFGLTPQRAVASFALSSDTPVYGLGEKGGALNKRGQLVSSRVEDALGVNTDLSYKNTPFAWAITPNGCWGILTHTTVDVAHGVGYPQWSNRSYAIVADEPQLDLFFFVADTPAQIVALYHQITGKPENVPLWSLGVWISRAYYR